MYTRKRSKSIILATAIFVCATNYAAAEITEVDPATGNALHSSGNALPEAGQARPLFHVTQDATNGPVGLSPAQVKHFYGFDKINTSAPGAGQVIAIIDAYDDPNIEADLGVFSKQFGLPACTTANKCFKKVYASGRQPAANAGWAMEVALDVEWAHAIAPSATIMLVEAASSNLNDLFTAINYAVDNGANVVSMSFGGSEFNGENYFDTYFSAGKAANVTFVASSGDNGHGVEYPAASPYVVSVGGTTMHTADTTGAYSMETAWSGSGGGISSYEKEPTDQSKYKLANDAQGYRAVPDVSYGADPNIGFSIYSSIPFDGLVGWIKVGGTSAGAPQWAAFFSIVNQLHGLKTSDGTTVYTLAGTSSVYSSIFHDVSIGTNGTCGIPCTAAKGFDFVTGLGSPSGQALAVDY